MAGGLLGNAAHHGLVLPQGPFRQSNAVAAFHGTLMGENAGAGYVGGLAGIGVGVPAFKNGSDELMYQVGMGAAMAAALNK